MLSHPGTPCVLYDDMQDPVCGPSIRQLLRMRRRNRIHAQSKVRAGIPPDREAGLLADWLNQAIDE